MNVLVERVLEVEKALSEHQGAFSLFALFLREDAPEKWDLIASAPWIEVNKEKALRVISDSVRQHLKLPELFAISRIVLVEPASPAVDAINRAFDAHHATIEVQSSNFFGLAIKHAYIFASKRLERLPVKKSAPNKAVQRTRRKAARR